MHATPDNHDLDEAASDIAGQRVASEVVLRDVWFGRTWRANAARVVEDDPGLTVLWMPKGAPALYPVDSDGAEVRIPTAERTLAERLTTRHALALLRPAARHSIWLLWDPSGTFEHWYVNFERTLGWSGRCFDIVDDKLDLIVAPDGALRWKDEDELEHAAELGLLEAESVRAEAERVVETWPFPTGWEQFEPNPKWPVPRFPTGWDPCGDP
jgi:hypothetical protein